jgi:lipid-binding SYLF domain-containing protein
MNMPCNPLAPFAMALCLAATPAFAADAAKIDAGVDAALAQFAKEVKGAETFLHAAKGVLVLPKVYKGGIGIGGEYGEGALRIGGKSVDYYSIASASFGWQLGAEAHSVVMAFMDQGALDKFRNSQGWSAGVDGSVALVDLGAAKDLSTTTLKDPVVGFVFGQKGLMYNLTLEGSKFTKLDVKPKAAPAPVESR